MNKFKLIALLLVGLIGTSAIVVNNDKLYEISKNIEIFVNVYKELNAQYVDDLDPSQLMKTGIDAMVESLDPYTKYISESQIESYRIQTDKKYDGIGASSVMIDGEITILEPFEDSPADQAGLKAGDVIVEVDGKSTEGKSEEDLNAIVRGLPGSELTIKIKRGGKEMEKTIVRGPITIKNVPYYGMVSDDIGYIALTTFTADAAKNISNAFKELRKDRKLKGLILDLRDNGGGFLREAISICNIFLPQNVEVVSTKSKVRERDKHFKTMGSPVDIDIPLTVMINNKSASASEIVSGVIQDMDRGVLIGQRSFGKGLVQNTMEVGYNNRVKVTTSKYYIPSGRCIQAVEYKDGEPVDIDDEKRSVFYTKNKRPVLDGGGVTPDVKLKTKKESSLIKALKEQHMIFKYVNQWVLNKDSIAEVGTFAFKDFEGFEKFLKDEGFTYQSESQKLLEKLKKETENEELNELVGQEISSVLDKIAQEHATFLEKDRSKIINLIEREIVTRFYYQKGKTQQRLLDDQEIEEAIAILGNPIRYNKLLKK